MNPIAAQAFEVGRTYNRKSAIHARYGGQEQGGISTPAGYPLVFMFTGKSGEQYGYSDHWTEDGVFRFTGEGQRGDMQFDGKVGNLAIRDHAQNGESLLLFESQGKSKGYVYIGEFVCSTWEYSTGPDADGSGRRTIVFHLVPVVAAEMPDNDGAPPPAGDLATLRRLALEAASPAAQATESVAKRIVYERSRAVRAYVLARSRGVCESCKTAAPFARKDGTPYLEPHHTRRVSDGGPDDPRWVGAVCPNCHREIHHGNDGESKNKALEDRIAAIEAS